MAKRRCPDGKFKALIIWNSNFSRRGGPKAGARVLTAWRRTVDKYEGKVRAVRNKAGTLSYGNRVERIDVAEKGGQEKAIRALRDAFTDPCVVHVAIFGHGGAGAAEIGDVIVTAEDLGVARDRDGNPVRDEHRHKKKRIVERWGEVGLDHLLTTLFLGVCCGTGEGKRSDWEAMAFQAWGSNFDQTEIREIEKSVDDIVLAPPTQPGEKLG